MFASAATPAPIVRTDRACYVVGQRVALNGRGFAPNRAYAVTIDGVDFGQSTTDASGSFASSLVPGGLPAGRPQHVDRLKASDGSQSASTHFTVTRRAGARLLASRGNPNTLRAPFEVWGFALAGGHIPIYLHYVSPGGGVRRTFKLGRAGGQCGYLRTKRRRVFPFKPKVGSWTLQIDTARRYSPQPRGPVARIRVRIL